MLQLVLLVQRRKYMNRLIAILDKLLKSDGQMVSDEKLLEAFEKVQTVIKEAQKDGLDHPSYFETLFLVGMVVFQEAGVDYVVLETGLGGRLDATNTVDHPLACIITSISIDHVEYLGDTIEKIAGEKAGIMKPGTPVIYDAHDPEAAQVMKKRAEELGILSYALTEDMYQMQKNTREGIDFVFTSPFGKTEQKKETQLSIPYIARYQMMNASLAFFTMTVLQEEHGIPEETLVRGLKKTRWEGRMETVLPGVVVDGAHNRDGIRRFVETASFFAKTSKITLLFSAVADKEYEKMIMTICQEIGPHAVVATQIDGDRVIPAEKLADLFRKYGCDHVIAEPSVPKAFDQANELKGDGMLFCVGSLYLVGEIKGYLARKQG